MKSLLLVTLVLLMSVTLFSCNRKYQFKTKTLCRSQEAKYKKEYFNLIQYR